MEIITKLLIERKEKDMVEKFEGSLSPKEQEEGYSKDFKTKVKEVFPDWDAIHKALDSDSELVGRYLDDSRGFTMKPEDIIKAFESGDQEKVLERAKRANEINKLYGEWIKIESR